MRFFSALDGAAGRWFGRRPAAAPAQVPEGLCVYAVGDVHGEFRLLERLLAAIGADPLRPAGTEPLVVFLGDYIDRGPDSRGVLDLLSAGPLSGAACRFLLGNHEAALLDFLGNPAGGTDWLSHGGTETLGSYGLRASVGTANPARCRALRDQLAERLPDAHLRFLKALEPLAVLGDYAFVHAGIHPGRPLDRQHPDDLIWIREPFLSSDRRHEKVIVHGHTIVREPELRHNRIGVDTGAYATGVLSALALYGTCQRFLQVRV